MRRQTWSDDYLTAILAVVYIQCVCVFVCVCVCVCVCVYVRVCSGRLERHAGKYSRLGESHTQGSEP